MKRKRKELEGKIGESAFRAIQRRLAHKTPEAAEESGAKLGRLLAKVAKKRFARAVDNIKLALPEIENPEEIAYKAFEHFGRISGDFLTLAERTPEQILQSIEFDDWGKIEEARSHNIGVIMITGHFGNWERMAAYMSYRGCPLSVVARDADQAGVTGMMNSIRAHSGVQVISRGNAARPMLEALRRNEMIGILPDQNSNEIFLPFFGHPAGTVLGPGVLHERTGSPVLGLYCIWLSPGKYRVIVDGPLEGQPTSTRGEGTMLAIHQSLERVIREHPTQWLWFHDRWRNARRKGLL